MRTKCEKFKHDTIDPFCLFPKGAHRLAALLTQGRIKFLFCFNSGFHPERDWATAFHGFMGCLFATGGFPVYILGPLFRWVICLFIITLLSSLSPCELTLFLNQCCIFFLPGAGVGNLFPVASLWRTSQLMSPRVLIWGASVCVTRKAFIIPIGIACPLAGSVLGTGICLKCVTTQPCLPGLLSGLSSIVVVLQVLHSGLFWPLLPWTSGTGSSWAVEKS